MLIDSQTGSFDGRGRSSAGAAPNDAARPGFDVAVPQDGYRWWYMDGLSDDGSQGVVVIAFIGSVFSPYYFRARALGRGDPLDHCAINVGLYRARGKSWCMTERGRRQVAQTRSRFQVGPSSLAWEGDRLVAEIRERSAPLPRAMHGRIILTPGSLSGHSFELDRAGNHLWRPVAACARIEVQMSSPRIAWQGHGYFDTNWGQRPLEQDFRGWHWSRDFDGSSASIIYAVTAHSAPERSLALRIPADGSVHESSVPAASELPPSKWGIRRPLRRGHGYSVERTLEDTPFYVRSLLARRESAHGDGVGPIVHESLDLERFRASWVRLLLPFRMPRRP